jgi:flagellar protein FliS
MMNMNPYVETLEQEVYSADPARLVVLLLRGARQGVEEAREALHQGDVRRRCMAVSRAVERIGELSLSLDQERGGEIAMRLAALYEYMVHRLNEANASQTEAPLEEVSRLMLPLIDAWSELSGGTGDYAGVPSSEAGELSSCFV